MRKMMVFLLTGLWGLVLAGCTHTTITNLTATTVPREASNLYRIEYQWNSNQQSVINESITPYVVVGGETYPMKRAKFTKNRWEAFVPVLAPRSSLTYHFKVDYKFRQFGGEGEASQVSPEYKLVIR